MEEPEGDGLITPSGGRVTFGSGERVAMDFPPGAVRAPVRVSLAALTSLPAPLPRFASFKGYALDFRARALADDSPLASFAKPVTITVRYGHLSDLGNAATQALLALFQYDPEQQTWRRLPTDVSLAEKTLTASTPSLAPLAVASSPQTNVGDYTEPWQPVVQDFQVDLFTGAATWRIPIDVPAGRGGLAPNLALVYHSGVVDELRGRVNPQTPGIGMGWALTVPYIERKIVRDEWGTPQVFLDGRDTFRLVMDGAASELVCVDTSVSPCVEYRTKDERFWRIRKLTGAPNESQYSGQTALKGEYWLATAPDGTTYRYGWSGDPTYYNQPYNEGEKSAWHMFGKEVPGDTIVPYIWRWNLDRVEDTHGNVASYFYEREKNGYIICNGGCWKAYDGNTQEPGWPYGYARGGHLSWVSYTRGHELGEPYRVKLLVSDDWDFWPHEFDSGLNGLQSVQTFWSKHVIDAVRVEDLNGQLIREYQLTRAYIDSAYIGNKILILTSVRVKGSGESLLPPTTFEYHWNWADHKSPLAAYRLDNCANGVDGGLTDKVWLLQVTTPLGGVYNVNYTAPLDWPAFQNGQTCDTVELDGKHWLRYRVREVKAMPGVGGTQYTVYEYRTTSGQPADGVWEGSGDSREFRGHAVVRVYRRRGDDPNGGPALAYRDVYFHQGDNDTVNGLCGVNVTDHDGMEGRAYRVSSYSDSGSELARTVTAHQFTSRAGGSHFIGVKAECAYSQPPSNDHSRQTGYDYDDYGNVTQVREYESAVGATPYRTTVTSYALNTTAWIVNRPKLIQVYAGSAGGTEASRIRLYYDRDEAGNVRGPDDPPLRGDWVRQEATDPATGVTATTERWVGALGNVTQTRDPDNRQTTITYDATFGQFALQTCNALGQCGHTEFYGIAGAPLDGGTLGQVRRTWDANGEATAVRYRYDVFGRLTTVIRPGDTDAQPTTAYTYGDGAARFYVKTAERETSGCGTCVRETFTFYDGLGRPVQTRAEAEASQQAVVNLVYDALGRLQDRYLPAFEATGSSFSRPAGWDARTHETTAYDALGRPTTITSPDGKVTTLAYEGWRTLTLDANDHQTIRETDAFGRLAKVEEYTGTDPYTLYATTVYTYDTSDRLTRVEDDPDGNASTTGNVTTMTYDGLGRKVRMADPDMGDWRYGYSPAGDLLFQIDAKRQAANFYYDALHRLVGKTYTLGPVDPDTYQRPADPGPGGYAAGYTYDDVTGGNYGLGRRTGMSDASGSKAWVYDARGRVTGEVKTIGGAGTFTTGYGYDALDRVTRLTYPSGEVVTNAFDETGALESVTSSLGTTYASQMNYNAAGLLTTSLLGSGIRIQSCYDEAGGSLHLLRLRAYPGSQQSCAVEYPAGAALNLRFLSYDGVGNITQIDDVTRGEITDYSYDALNRLVSAQARSGASPVYQQTFEFDRIGNLRSVGNLGVVTVTPTATPTSTATSTATPTPSPTPTASPSPTPTSTPTATPTATPIGAIAVNTTADELNADGDCALREAIQAANTNTAVDACPAGSAVSPDTILIPAGTYSLARPPDGTPDDNADGDLDIGGDLLLSGAGAGATVVDGNALDRVLHVLSSTVELRGLTVRGGNSGASSGGGIRQAGGSLTLTDVAVQNNATTADGGGLTACTGCTLTVRGSTFSGNSVGDDGGGVYLSGATARLTNSTLSGNSADDHGGGLYSSTSTGVAWLANVTVTGNMADADESGAGDGGGIGRGAGSVNLKHTLLAGNSDSLAGTRKPDCSGTLTSQGYNLLGDNLNCSFAATTGDQVGTDANPIDPRLGPLGDNGGPTWTHALLAGSPAIDAGDPTGCTDPQGNALTIDQRGQPRPADGDGNGSAICDLGAYEAAAETPPPSATPSPTSTPSNAPTNTPTATPTWTPSPTATSSGGVTIAVNTTADELNTDGDCALREAVRAADTNAAVDACPAGSAVTADTILIPAGTYVLTRTGVGEDAASTGDLDLTGDVILGGTGAPTTVIDGNATDRVFHVLNGAAVQLSGLTIQNGSSGSSSGGGLRMSTGSATLTDVAVRDNATTADGGGLYANGGALTVVRGLIAGNSAGGKGGGVYGNGAGVVLRLTDGTLSGNTAKDHGGGVYVTNSATAWAYNVTVTGNTADSDASGAGDGGGLYRTGATLNLKHSVVAGNADASAGTRHPDCSGALTSQGYNLVGDDTGCTIAPATGDQIGTGASPIDPRLGPLADNGGPTWTHALLAGSPAMDAGDPAGCTDSQGNALTVDQRGQPRPADGDGNGSAICDLGAYEVVPPATPSASPTATASPTAAPTPGWQYVTYAYSAPGHVHAVSGLSTGETYQYDANGNMTTRGEGGTSHTQAFDAENRLASVTANGQTTQFVYDGDGALVKKVRPDGTATIYIGTIYEVELSAGGAQTGATSYYAVPGARVQRTGGSLYYVLTDHLGSASVTLDASGAVLGEQRYYPFGATRLATGTWPTDRLFTGQREIAGLGIYHFAARFYSPALGRFVSADAIVPEPGNPQALNRYAYANNSPLRYTDPSGHWVETAWDIANIAWDIYEVRKDPSWLNIGALAVDVGAAVLPFIPGGVGLVLRGGKAARAAAEVASHADDAVHAAKAVGDAADLVSRGSDALQAASRLKQVGLYSDEAADLIKTISRGSTKGSLREGGITVLGHYILGDPSNYMETAKRMSANYLDMDEAVWKSLDDAQRWAINRQFLDDAIARGDTFYLSTELVKGDSFFGRELAYLYSLGYEVRGNFLIKVR